MRLFLILAVASFLQSSFLPFDLALILLLCRCLIVEDNNLLIPFASGILLSFLTTTNLGLYPLVFIAVAQMSQLFKRSALSTNLLTVFVFIAISLGLVNLLEILILHSRFDLGRLILEIAMAIPLYLAVYFWEERFILPQKKSLFLRKGN